MSDELIPVPAQKSCVVVAQPFELVPGLIAEAGGQAAWRMIRRRQVAAVIRAPIGNHSFPATGITAHSTNGGALEHAQSGNGCA